MNTITSQPKIVLLTNAYPSPQDKYKNAFVHTRVKKYIENNLNIAVVVFTNNTEKIIKYTYENIYVTRIPRKLVGQFLEESRCHTVLVHFFHHELFSALDTNVTIKRAIIWIHGYEAESWYRRWFNLYNDMTQLRHAIDDNGYNYQQQKSFKAMLNNPKKYYFVNVSDWFFRSIFSVDMRLDNVRSYIIPNPINNFQYVKCNANPDQRFRVLSLRPFNSYKYANDVSVNAIADLSKYEIFNKFNFTIAGDGPDFYNLLYPLRKFKNVKIIRGFFDSSEIYQLHKNHGIFLCPTRLDSQGVSMCEAMSSGLVPISTDCSAIPEFVKNNVNGLLANKNSGKEFSSLLKFVADNSEIYLKLSCNASRDMEQLCGIDKVIKQEIAVITNNLESIDIKISDSSWANSAKNAYSDLDEIITNFAQQLTQQENNKSFLTSIYDFKNRFLDKYWRQR